MEVSFLATDVSRRTIAATVRGKIGLAADDGFDPARLHRVVERDGAVHVAVIGYGARVHSQLLGAFGERFYLNCAVEKTVIGM